MYQSKSSITSPYTGKFFTMLWLKFLHTILRQYMLHNELFLIYVKSEKGAYKKDRGSIKLFQYFYICIFLIHLAGVISCL
jgi:hypothetical protein